MSKNTFSLNDRYDFNDEFPFEKNRPRATRPGLKNEFRGEWVESYEIPGYYGSRLSPGRHEFIKKRAKNTCDIIQEKYHERNIPYTTYMKDLAQICEYEAFRDLYVQKGIISDITYKEFLDRYYRPSIKMEKLPQKELPITVADLKHDEYLDRRRKRKVMARQKMLEEAAIALGLKYKE